ncbi:MAG: GNAT family N-acetyltransferase [Jiangellaceae bacterium]
MAEINTRALDEDDWQIYRRLRLEGLRESPDAFVATYSEEELYDEPYWRDHMRRAHRLVAERDGEPVGIVSIGGHDDDPKTGEVFGLWVTPSTRNSRVAWQLVTAAAKQAPRDGFDKLYFWVGTENGPAVAFASSFGFRPTYKRRPARATDEVNGNVEAAMVLSLSADPTSVKNPLLP